MALLQMGFVLTHRPAPDENMALEALHGAAYGHHYRVDLHRYLTCRSQDKNLRKKGLFVKKVRYQQPLTFDWGGGGGQIKDRQVLGSSQSVRPRS